MLSEISEFPSTATASGARVYQVTKSVQLYAAEITDPLPGAPHGSIIYAFMEGERVGRWDWARNLAALELIMQAYRTGVSPDYKPPRRFAPDGSPPMIRPPNENLLAHAIEAGRPDGMAPPEGVIPLRQVDPSLVEFFED